MFDEIDVNDETNAIAIVETKQKPKQKQKPTKINKTLTTVEIAKDRGLNPKSLRARIRRNIDAWEPLFLDGKRHVFKNNKTIRGKIEKLLA